MRKAESADLSRRVLSSPVAGTDTPAGKSTHSRPNTAVLSQYLELDVRGSHHLNGTSTVWAKMWSVLKGSLLSWEYGILGGSRQRFL